MESVADLRNAFLRNECERIGLTSVLQMRPSTELNAVLAVLCVGWVIQKRFYWAPN